MQKVKYCWHPVSDETALHGPFDSLIDCEIDAQKYEQHPSHIFEVEKIDLSEYSGALVDARDLRDKINGALQGRAIASFGSLNAQVGLDKLILAWIRRELVLDRVWTKGKFVKSTPKFGIRE